MKIAYYLNTDIQHFPPIYRLYPHLKGPVYTKKDKIVKFLKEKYPEVEVLKFKKNKDIRQDIAKKKIRLVVYPSFLTLSIGKAVQIFHGGLSDKVYVETPKIGLYDLVCFPGEKTRRKVENAGYLKLIPNWKIVGYPKFDPLINNSIEKADLFKDKTKKTILYAPTWISSDTVMKNVKFSEYGESSLPNFGLDIVKELGKKYNLIVKFHNRVYRKKNDIFEQIEAASNEPEFCESVKCVWDDNILPYMAAADLMVSDISTACYEWFHFDKPILFANPAPEHYQPSDNIFSNTYAWNAGDVIYKKEDIEPLAAKNLAEDIHKAKRKEIFEITVYKPDGQATNREVEAIKEYYQKIEKIPYSLFLLNSIIISRFKAAKLVFQRMLKKRKQK